MYKGIEKLSVYRALAIIDCNGWESSRRPDRWLQVGNRLYPPKVVLEVASCFAAVDAAEKKCRERCPD